jgi:hypothetical protein
MHCILATMQSRSTVISAVCARKACWPASALYVALWVNVSQACMPQCPEVIVAGCAADAIMCGCPVLQPRIPCHIWSQVQRCATLGASVPTQCSSSSTRSTAGSDKHQIVYHFHLLHIQVSAELSDRDALIDASTFRHPRVEFRARLVFHRYDSRLSSKPLKLRNSCQWCHLLGVMICRPADAAVSLQHAEET